MKILVRFSLVLLFSLFAFRFSLTPVSAQTPNQYAAPNTNPDVPRNLHTYTQNVVIEVMAAAACQLTGIDPVNPNQQCLGADPKTGKIGFVDPSTGSGQAGGVVGLMGNLIATTYNLPISSGDYVTYLAHNFGIAKSAHAQSPGVGFQGLNPLTKVWSVFRNITYLLLVIVFVIVGFAIMLRVKIDPRTVMTIENQIPKIIAAILLITFSFAIAGFLIDLMWVTIYFIVGVLAQVDPKLRDQLLEISRAATPFDAAGKIGEGVIGWSSLIANPANAVGGIISKLFDNPAGYAISGVIGSLIGAAGGTGVGSIIMKGAQHLKYAGFLGALIGFAVTQVTSATIDPGFIVGQVAIVVATLILAIAVLWALVRLWFALIIAYVYILIDVVLAPFWILAGLFPGSPIGFGPWLRDILANLIAFPATIAMFLLGKVFIQMFGEVQTGGQFVPPLIGNPASTNAIGALIGLGIILMTPNVVTMLKDLLKSPQFKYTAAIGQAVGVGAGATNIPGHITSIGQFGYGINMLKNLGGLPFVGKLFVRK